MVNHAATSNTLTSVTATVDTPDGVSTIDANTDVPLHIVTISAGIPSISEHIFSTTADIQVSDNSATVELQISNDVNAPAILGQWTLYTDSSKSTLVGNGNVIVTNHTEGTRGTNSTVTATLNGKPDTTIPANVPSGAVAAIQIGNTVYDFTIDSTTPLTGGFATGVTFTATNHDIQVPPITARWDTDSISDINRMVNPNAGTHSVGTNGISTQVSISNNDPITIHFTRVVKIPLQIEIEVNVATRLFPSTGTEHLLRIAANYINNLNIGDHVDITNLQSSLLTGVPGIVPPDENTPSIEIKVARKVDNINDSTHRARIIRPGGGIRGIGPSEELTVDNTDINVIVKRND